VTRDDGLVEMRTPPLREDFLRQRRIPANKPSNLKPETRLAKGSVLLHAALKTRQARAAPQDRRFVDMFAYDDAVAERYPTIRAGVIHATGLANGPSSSMLLDEYRAEQQATSERLKATAIADLPSIAAWPSSLHSYPHPKSWKT
jgi:hypothetical protein